MTAKHRPHLADDTVHIRYIRLSEITDTSFFSRCQTLVAPDERERLERFHFDRDRQRYLAGRALVRLVLAECTNREPEELKFIHEQNGRPRLAEEPLLNFSLSYTKDLVAVALHTRLPVGLDVEYINHGFAWHEIAKQHFAQSEYSDLVQQPVKNQAARFFAYWTLKEAYLKAQGLGITTHLDRAAFTLATKTPELLPADGQNTLTTWQFRSIDISTQHSGALALNTQAGPMPRLAVSNFVPKW